MRSVPFLGGPADGLGITFPEEVMLDTWGFIPLVDEGDGRPAPKMVHTSNVQCLYRLSADGSAYEFVEVPE